MLKMKQLRLRKGISQFELARRTGIHPSNLSRIERGVLPAYKNWATKIARALGWPVEKADELFQKVEE